MFATRSLLPFFLLLSLAMPAGLFAADAAWKPALPGWRYEFPRDHRSHPDFKTEWWYFTGNLRAEDDREFGYQLTFFRQGIVPPGGQAPASSRFVVSGIQFAHFAIADLHDEDFHFRQKLSRGAYGEAGFADDRLAWIDDWEVRLEADGAFHLAANDDGRSIDLVLQPAKHPVVHGADGVSRKSAGEGRASHYYSLTRLQTSGSLTIGGRAFRVEGASWFDHEWATNQLAAHQTGWDWFSLHFDDGSELMLFQIRTRDGGRDEFSGGTFIDAAGKAMPIANADFTLEPAGIWKSPATGAAYPLRWRVAIPGLKMELDVAARIPDQELRLDPVSYWEGAVRATGRRNGRATAGVGYLEMTGYAGPVVGLGAGQP